ncbi:ribosomal-protein-alanine N-acetyltransferase [Thermosulfurimonas marina]|uniref:Ribosomal-protein-alanine N-acetyltransferase n=1 Tax=Thermosulfurimonas marina TaxID=2047767 RepID=A0A6H1WUR6_9BACT|nr:ribosomal protein S18-alanine N-acetyltransferase [Thermosulfurimonas marina]QJA06942.1 ribosomal-protein-alanine N-acetyltransferase [Thermosulfurimonas marina]
MKIEIRQARPEDLPEILRIEKASFARPWSEVHWRYEFEKPQTRVLVVTVEDQVVGYLCSWLMGEEMEIANLAVAPEWRGKGLGKALLTTALRMGLEEGVRRVWLEVREGNRVAQRLYRSLGFVVVGRRKGYYPDTGEDALIMGLSLTQALENLNFLTTKKERRERPWG